MDHQLLNKPLTILMLFTCLLLNGCGFQLRGAHYIPVELQTLHLDSVDRYSELLKLLKSHFSVSGITILSEKHTSSTATRFTLYKDQLDRRTLSLFPNGQVAEYGLIYSVKYAITVQDQLPQYFEFEIYRDYQDDPQSALAKSKELTLILTEMRQQAATTILRQMASFTTDNHSSTTAQP